MKFKEISREFIAKNKLIFHLNHPVNEYSYRSLGNGKFTTIPKGVYIFSILPYTASFTPDDKFFIEEAELLRIEEIVRKIL